ncbi:MAG: family protein phosphatase [Actinomycetota bacterium]|jgi:serine/threonine protein phosphatase PrpC|nr:family protein phosphatase [Actinomycetota bacterium]
MKVAARTEVGHVRRRNEDALLVEESAGVVAVADGLGGHPSGDVASRAAVVSLQQTSSSTRPAGEQLGQWVTDALLTAHQAVLDEAGDDPERAGMATTAVLAVVGDTELWIGHVGDSRGYLLSAGGQLQALTRDHGMGGYITQALGLERDVVPDVAHVDVSSGDRLLLCTDGLTNMVDEPRIAALLGDNDVQAATDGLVEAALANGGVDNVTVIVVEF